MKSSLINLYQGYFSILKYIFTGRNDGKFLQLNFGLPFILIVLMAIGFARNLLAVLFGIRLIFPGGMFFGFYSMRPDIVFVMAVFPVYLCFFGALILSLFLRVFSKQRYDKEILSICFYLQALHLLVPFLDILNFKIDIPFYFQIFPIAALQFLVAHVIVMTVGIIVVWMLSGVAVIRFLKDLFQISPLKIFLIIFLIFNLFLWPIYLIFPFSNYLFNAAFSIKEIDDPMNMGRTGEAYALFYGYATFFFFLAIPGIFYFRKIF